MIANIEREVLTVVCVRALHARERGWHTLRLIHSAMTLPAPAPAAAAHKVVEEQQNWQPRGRYPFPCISDTWSRAK